VIWIVYFSAHFKNLFNRHLLLGEAGKGQQTQS
jgi:hypothetical protein